MLLDKLMEWDKLEDRRSVVLWKGLPSPHHYDKTLIEKVYLFMRTANVAENATKAFYKFGRSKQRQIIMEDKRDWQKLFEEYLEVAFSKKDDNKETQKQIQIEFLEALTGSNDENGKFKKDDSFLQFLREGKVELEVTAEQKKLLKSAWRHVPEALNHVKVKK